MTKGKRGMHRTLCPVEKFYIVQRSRAVIPCTVHGDVDEKLLAAAFAAKVAEHPSLRCRIEQAGEACVLQPLEEPDLPGLVVRPGGPTAFSAELNTPLLMGGPLVRAVLLRGEAEHTTVLSVDHTISDGHSAIALHDALWRTYSALADGKSITPAGAGGSWPDPVTDRLPPCPKEELEQYLARRIERTRRFPIAALPYEAVETDGAGHRQGVDVRRVLLQPGQTTRLVRFSKAAEVSVHGLVSAALLIALRRKLGADANARALGCLSPLDLRARLTPPLQREVMVPAVASYLDVLEVTDDADPLSLGRQVTANLHAAIERGDFIQEARILSLAVSNPALLTASVIVTNLGCHPSPPTPRGLDVTDVRLIPVREHYYPEAGKGPLMACVVSFDNRLSIELPYSTECFSHEQIREIRNSVQTTLLTFVGHDETDDTVRKR